MRYIDLTVTKKDNVVCLNGKLSANVAFLEYQNFMHYIDLMVTEGQLSSPEQQIIGQCCIHNLPKVD